MSKSWITAEERPIVEAIASLAFCNPFLPERLALERRILGDAYQQFFIVWHAGTDLEDDNPNVVRIAERASVLAERLRLRLGGGGSGPRSERERRQYQELCLYALYYKYHVRFYEIARAPEKFRGGRHASFYNAFKRDFDRLLGHPRVTLPDSQPAEHVFACLFQLRRAFHFTFRSIAGSSMPAARLRAQVWQSVFTHDLHRYQRLLYERMGDVTTLITGPTGAGKELVARAIGHSRYIPFDTKTHLFRESFEGSFFPLNLSALSPTLIESELFGHMRGSFTGAVADRKGWLELCPPLGAVFLDEIGEIDAAIQIKLLRVVEARTFAAIGSTKTLNFRGKVIAATNRDLGVETGAGRFREDFYYRLCADTVVAPSLRERIADSPDELSILLRVLSERLVGAEESAVLAEEAEAWIHANLGREYAWPGNVRELSQCLSNVLIHRDYRPLGPGAGRRSKLDRWVDELRAGGLTADELLDGYCKLVHEKAGSFSEAARILGLDRRTVKARVERADRV